MRFGSNIEHGAATLVFTITILMLGTLAVFGLAQAVLMAQKIANNSTRTAQAFEAAEAAMHAALDYLADDPDRDMNGHPDPVFDTNADNIGDASAAQLGSGAMAVATQDVSDGALTRLAITAHGYSDDRSARRTISQTLVTIDPVPHLPRHALVVGGALHVHGVTAVSNAYGHDALWSGGAARIHDGGVAAIALPDTADAAYPACIALAGGCALNVAKDVASTGVVTNDETLAALTPDAQFHQVFGIAPETFAAALVTRATTPDAFNRDAQRAGHGTIRVEGMTRLRDVTIGCKVDLADGAPCPDAQRTPAVVIVAGDAEIVNAVNLYGLLFVGGSLTIAGALRLDGALVATGDVVVGNGAKLDLRFDIAVLDALRRAGPRVPLAGTWQEH